MQLHARFNVFTAMKIHVDEVFCIAS